MGKASKAPPREPNVLTQVPTHVPHIHCQKKRLASFGWIYKIIYIIHFLYRIFQKFVEFVFEIQFLLFFFFSSRICVDHKIKTNIVGKFGLFRFFKSYLLDLCIRKFSNRFWNFQNCLFYSYVLKRFFFLVQYVENSNLWTFGQLYMF